MDSDEDEQIGGVKKTAGRKPKGRKKSTTTTTKTTTKSTKKTGKGRKAKNFLDSDSDDGQNQIEQTTANNKKQKLDESTDLKRSLVESTGNELFKNLDNSDNLSITPSISTQIFTATSRSFKVPLHENRPLNWSHKINLIGEKSLEQRIRLCDVCREPILYYGRLIPCKHVFCFDCAIEIQEKGSGCLRCNERIVRIERNNLNSMFICNHDKQCKRTYLSQRDLLAHIQHRHTKKDKNNSSSEKSLKIRTNSSFNEFQSSSFANQQKSNNGHHSIHYPQPSLHTLQWTQALAAASSNAASGQPFIPPNTRFSGTSTPSSGWPNNRNYYP